MPIRSSSACRLSTSAELVAHRRPGREALEVPGDVLADVAAGPPLVAVVEVDEVGRVPAQRGRHLAQPRLHPRRRPGERRGEVGEQPRPPEAARAPRPPRRSRSARTISRASSADQMSPLPSTGIDVTASLSRAIADQSACPEYAWAAVRPCSATAATPSPSAIRPGIQVGDVVGVDADPHLHGDRHGVRRRLAHDRGDDAAEQVGLPRQRRAAALAGDLGHRAAEVEVDVVGAVLGDQDAGGQPGRDRVDRVQLHRARVLVGVVRDEPHRLRACARPAPGSSPSRRRTGWSPRTRHRPRDRPCRTRGTAAGRPGW